MFSILNYGVIKGKRVDAWKNLITLINASTFQFLRQRAACPARLYLGGKWGLIDVARDEETHKRQSGDAAEWERGAKLQERRKG